MLNGNYTWGAALLNDGQGNYSPQANFLAGNSIHSVPGYAVAMDLNKDGKTDVLFANVADGTGNGCAAADYALLSNGDGTFSPIAATQLPNPGSCSAQATSAPLFAVDLNGDGMQDLVSNSGNYTLLNISGWGAASASLASPHPVNAPGGLLALTAVYQPSGSFAGSTSSPASVNGTHIATITTLSSPPRSCITGR